METLARFPENAMRRVGCVLTDIDDTLTSEGWLTPNAYAAIAALAQAGISVVPITGRPAGWCDMIARLWPVEGVVGENGAFYFRYDRSQKRMFRRYADPAETRAVNRANLAAIGERILAEVPGAAISADQAYRETDLAIDFCEDVPQLPDAAIDRIVALFRAGGATAKVSSIHVNGWFGQYDKLSMTRAFAADCLGVDLDAKRDEFVFVGDSPNDAPMFDFFPFSVGVANVRAFEDRLEAAPKFVTSAPSGAGFAEVAAALIAAHSRVK